MRPVRRLDAAGDGQQLVLRLQILKLPSLPTKAHIIINGYNYSIY